MLLSFTRRGQLAALLARMLYTTESPTGTHPQQHTSTAAGERRTYRDTQALVHVWSLAKLTLRGITDSATAMLRQSDCFCYLCSHSSNNNSKQSSELSAVFPTPLFMFPVSLIPLCLLLLSVMQRECGCLSMWVRQRASWGRGETGVLDEQEATTIIHRQSYERSSVKQ
jgi:hypothetical protein